MLEEIKYILCDSTGRGPLEVCSWFPPDFALCTFFCWFCCVFFSVVNYGHEYNNILSPVSPSSKSLNPGVVWTPQHTSFSEQSKKHLFSQNYNYIQIFKWIKTLMLLIMRLLYSMCFIYKYIFVPFASKFGSCKYYFGGLVMYLLSKIGSLKYIEVCLFQKK